MPRNNSRYFKVKVREPYMGNDVPLKIEIWLIPDHPKPEYTFNVIVKSPEGIKVFADEITAEVFNE